MRSTSSWSWKSPLDRRLTSRMATRPFQFMGMEEKHTPQSELLPRSSYFFRPAFVNFHTSCKPVIHPGAAGG